MADTAEPWAQIQTILRTVLTHPAFSNGSGPITRTIIVTDAVADFKVSERLLHVHPEWAVEKGPLEAAAQLRAACHGFDQRRAEARARRDAELRARLFDVMEDVRRAGAEYLFDEVYHAPTARRRSLTKPEDTHD